MPADARRQSVPRRPLPLAILTSLIVGAACTPLQLPPAATTTAPGGAPSGSPAEAPATTPAPARASSPAAVAPIPVATGTTQPVRRVALVLPLSGRRETAGIAVRDGYIAGHLAAAAGSRPELIFIDENRVSAAEAYQQATTAGADVIVGPLLKEAVQAMAPLTGPIPVLALNTLGDDVAGPPGFWQFGLVPEDEARAVARRALTNGHRRAAALAPGSDWGQRVLNAFNAEFRAGGGELLAWRFYEPGAADYSDPIKVLLQIDPRQLRARRTGANRAEDGTFTPSRRQDIDLIFLVANMSDGRQLRPQLRFFEADDLPTYAVSAIWEDGSGEQPDLNGVAFPDGPWIVDPDGPGRLARSTLLQYWPRGTLAGSRLFALGHDAATLVPWLRRGVHPTAGLDGASGTLFVDDGGIVRRELTWAEIRAGRPVPMATPTGSLQDPLLPGATLP